VVLQLCFSGETQVDVAEHVDAPDHGHLDLALYLTTGPAKEDPGIDAKGNQGLDLRSVLVVCDFPVRAFPPTGAERIHGVPCGVPSSVVSIEPSGDGGVGDDPEKLGRRGVLHLGQSPDALEGPLPFTGQVGLILAG